MKRAAKTRGSRDRRIALAGLIFAIVTAVASPKARIQWPTVRGDESTSLKRGMSVRRIDSSGAGTSATLALELPHDLREFEILTATVDARYRIRYATFADSFFIVGYTMFFVAFATTIGNERARTLMVMLAALTAILDFTENQAILTSLTVWSIGHPASMQAILTASSLKWFTFFSVIVCMSASLGRRREKWERAAALALRTAAAGGSFGAVAAFLSPSARAIIAGALTLTAAAIAFVFGASIVEIVIAARKTNKTDREMSFGVSSSR
jgi:hypothetical protein